MSLQPPPQRSNSTRVRVRSGDFKSGVRPFGHNFRKDRRQVLDAFAELDASNEQQSRNFSFNPFAINDWLNRIGQYYPAGRKVNALPFNNIHQSLTWRAQEIRADERRYFIPCPPAAPQHGNGDGQTLPSPVYVRLSWYAQRHTSVRFD